MARCTVERLMREMGLHGARRGRRVRTTVRDDGHERASDLLRRGFTASSPNRRWVADFTHVTTWAGVVYVAFVVDIFPAPSSAGPPRPPSGPGWCWMPWTGRCGDAIVAGRPFGPGLVHHSDAGSQYTSFRFTTHLVGAGIDASIGTVGDVLDNALLESAIGL